MSSFLCILVYILSVIFTHSLVHSQELHERSERALLFPKASTIGILAALALPLNDRKDVFLSYNFEANYNSPAEATNYIPGPLTRLDLVRSFSSSSTNITSHDSDIAISSVTDSADTTMDDSNATNSTTANIIFTNATKPLETIRERRSLITRRNFYKFIEKKLYAAGLNGHRCLLRTICEAAETPLGIHNGVLGDIMHIMFTPSSSASEDIPSDFYEAELHGTQRQCKRYQQKCSTSLLDLISTLNYLI